MTPARKEKWGRGREDRHTSERVEAEENERGKERHRQSIIAMAEESVG